jgi:hypothetical protein
MIFRILEHCLQTNIIVPNEKGWGTSILLHAIMKQIQYVGTPQYLLLLFSIEPFPEKNFLKISVH